MAATSPYTQNDYTAVKMRPAELPMADIFKGLQVKNAYWEQKASQIKGVYDQAFNLKLTSSENKEIKAKTIDLAKGELKRLSATDLNDPAIREQGLKVFEPLFKDDKVLKDDFLTGLRQKIMSDAEGFKNADGGKQYSDINLEDALHAFAGFNDKTKREDIDGIYNAARNSRYVPYYDLTKTFEGALDSCKGAINQDTDAAGLNFRTTKTSGISSATARLCLESAVAKDNKAMEQIGINGRVQFRNNREGLIRGSELYLDEDIEILNNGLTALQVTRLAAEKELGDKFTPEMTKAYEEQASSINTRLKEALATKEQFKKGNYSVLDTDYDSWAQKVYKSTLLKSYAEPRATYGTQVTYSANMGKITEYKEQGANVRFQIRELNENTRAERKNKFDLAMHKDTPFSMKVKLFNELGLDGNALVTALDVAADEPMTYDMIKGAVNESEKAVQDAEHDFIRTMRSIDDGGLVNAFKFLPPNSDDVTEKQADAAIAAAQIYIKKITEAAHANKTALKPEDRQLIEDLKRFRGEMDKRNAIAQTLKDTKDAFDKTDAAKAHLDFTNSKEYKDEVYSAPSYTFIGVTGRNSITLSAERVDSIIKGTDSEYKVDRFAPSGAASFSPYTTSVYRPVIVKINPQQGDVPLEAPLAISNILTESKDRTNKYNEGLNAAFSENRIVNRNLVSAEPFQGELMSYVRPFIAGSTAKDIEFHAKTADLKKGEVAFEVLIKGVPITNMTGNDFKKLFSGASQAQLSALVDFKSNSTGSMAIIKIPSVRQIIDTPDIEGVDYALVNLNAAIKKNGTSAVVVYTNSNNNYELILTGSKYSTGIRYTLKLHDGIRSDQPIAVNISEGEIKARIEEYKKTNGL